MTNKKGFALVAVLGLISVLLIMLGALMGTNRTAFGLLQSSQASERGRRTIDSVQALCQSFLESDYHWGQEGFQPGDLQKKGGSLSWEFKKKKSNPGVSVIEGDDSANETSFKVEIYNNLKADGSAATIKDVEDKTKLKSGVPVGFCLLRISVNASGRFEGAEIMMRNPGMIGAAAIGSESLSIDARYLDLLSKDPIKNQMRSMGKTMLQGGENFIGGKISNVSTTEEERNGESILKKNTTAADPVIWSADSIKFKGESDPEFLDKDEYKSKHPGLAAKFKDERFVDQAKARFDVPEISLSDVENLIAKSDTGKSEEIPSGLYRFEQYGIGAGRVRVLTKYQPGQDGAGNSILSAVKNDDTVKSASVEQFWWLWEPDKSGIPAPSAGAVAKAISDSTGLAVSSSLGTERAYGDSSVNSYISLNGAGGNAKADLLNRRLVLNDSYNFKVEGDFSIIGSAPSTSENPDGRDDMREVNPALYFGNPAEIAMAGDVGTAGVVAGAANAVAGSGVLARKANQGVLYSTGKMHIQGDITATGVTLAAKQDLTLEPGRLSAPSGDENVDFSLFSEHDVNILPPPILEGIESRLNNEDGKVVGLSRAINSSEQNINFTGLIYARNNVNIDLQDTKKIVPTPSQSQAEAEEYRYRNLRLEGAIVAKSGRLKVDNANLLRLIYNPSFVDKLVPTDWEAPNNRRFEVVSWRQIKPEGL